jgi:hypothetical protein
MSYDFKLNIRLANAEMQTPADLAYALSVLAAKLRNDSAGSAYDPIEMTEFTTINGNIMDANGQPVGYWNVLPEVASEPEQPEGSIHGKVRLNDGTTSEFSLDMPDEQGEALAGWQQWGTHRERLGRTSELVAAMQAATYETPSA